ncbi:GNAT family N-acetyltransferase [Sellimonas caecigallum]|uniref:GNAT family N-acetyltransferase n=1 Tax=Sellimonas caecigallum TaxID=2592333 RepID=A0ABS7L4R4_9FIRM|nr:GNAT family protein [Sellimonas caecigallum]MBY0758046.1 GNAT family N-acetyltransferase [Sellimonas caecigallum]
MEVKHIYLKIPDRDELHHRKAWMMDPETMAYNAGFDMKVDGYDKATGTIRKTDTQLQEWYDKWTTTKKMYFAYIYDAEEKIPVGEVYYQYQDDISAHMVGIVIASRYRGKGYAYPALIELERIAFEENGVEVLLDMFPEDRTEAVKLFMKAGFTKTDMGRQEIIFGKQKILRQFSLTKKQYKQKR